MSLLDPICHAMWSLTPYLECDYRCVYCCTRVQGKSVLPGPAAELLEQLRAQLASIAFSDLIIIGAFSDGYPSVEAQVGFTREVVAELVQQGRRFVIVTKGTSVLRDVDLLAAAPRGRCLVQISLSSLDDDVLRRIDPGAPPGSERMKVLRALRGAGIRVNVNALPWIPGVTETGEIIRRTPSDVGIIFSPLACGRERDSINLLGRRYGREEIWAAYLAEYERYGRVPNTSWVKPSQPPTENDPLYRLPAGTPWWACGRLARLHERRRARMFDV